MKAKLPSLTPSTFTIGKNFVRSTILGTTVVCGATLATIVADAVGEPVDEFGTNTIEPAQQPIPAELVEDKGGEPSAGIAESEEEPETDTATQPRSGNAKVSNEATTILNVKDVDIATLIKSFSRLTNRNYIIDSSVKGKVSILLPSAVTISEALRILDSVLLLKGFTTVPVEKNTWKVIVAKEAKQTTIPFGKGSSDTPSDQLVTQIIRLKNVQASELQPTVAQFISKDGMVNAFAQTNSLIVIDSAANMERLMRMTKELDVPALDQDITIIPILHAEAKDVAEKINQLLGEGEQRGGSSTASSTLPRIPGVPALPSSITNASSPAQIASISDRSGGGAKRSLPAKVIPDERTNSLVVVADATTTMKIRAITEQLDSPVDKSGGRFFVYRLKHADAEELSEILNGLISGTPPSPSEKSGRTGSSLSGSSKEKNTRNTSSRSRSKSRDESASSTAPTNPSTSRAASSGEGGGGKVAFEGEVTIAPDPATNALIINASRSDYLRLKEVIDELDVKRRQVVVEATILEVSLDKNEGTGIELQGTVGNDNGGVFAQTNYGGLTNLLKNPTALSDLTVAAASTGTLTLPGGLVIPSQAVLVSAVSKNSNVNVLSSPTIVTTDNQEAEIVVGENVPFVSSQSTDSANLGNTFTQIERQDVGITLRITPQISAGSFVTLKIFVEISGVVDSTRNATNGPTTTVRTTETNVEVKNGQMVVTGGLIADNLESGTRGVPYFQDIPVLGHLFRQDGERRRRTNLLIFITPRILKDQYDVRDETVERRDKLELAINEQGAEPNRSDVLHREDIDRVAEMLPNRSVQSSPITPPTPLDSKAQGAWERTQDRLNKLQPNESPSVEAIPEFKIKPRLPEAPQTSSSHGSPSVVGDAPAKRAAVPTQTPSPQSFVVLRSERGETVGLVVPSSTATFFVAGKKYRRENDPFVCLGRYGSKSQAQSSHSTLSSWQELSVRDSLQLGEGTWRRG